MNLREKNIFIKTHYLNTGYTISTNIFKILKNQKTRRIKKNVHFEFSYLLILNEVVVVEVVVVEVVVVVVKVAFVVFIGSVFFIETEIS